MKENPRVTTILFDLDETLSDHSYSLKRAFLALKDEYPVIKKYEMPVLMNMYQESLDGAFKEYLEKKISYADAKYTRVKLFFQKLHSPIDDEEVNRFLEKYNEVYFSDRRATDGTIKTLETLRQRGYKIGIVTNGEENVQAEKLKEIGIELLVDVLVTSSTVGFAKPAPEIYAAALSQLQAGKEEAIMIGDKIETDVAGAVAYGMKAILYSPESKETEVSVGSAKVPIINNMEQVLTYLGLK